MSYLSEMNGKSYFQHMFKIEAELFDAEAKTKNETTLLLLKQLVYGRLIGMLRTLRDLDKITYEEHEQFYKQVREKFIT